ncbi:hypothetical protein [Spirosoma spitsbergense]|uniref:hypothetical protein n=1 Tax=Spirosoma spitsbergense TaxID=431554 RepID=UPI0012F87CE9|nr:hypothetical protein [Spirosoma spitsbergense]
MQQSRSLVKTQAAERNAIATRKPKVFIIPQKPGTSVLNKQWKSGQKTYLIVWLFTFE